MARVARLEELGLPMHLIVQGHGRRPIAHDVVDRSRLIRRATRVFREDSVDALAWSALDNHAHLVARATATRLARPMQRWLGPYAREFNARHGSVGRVFRDRFFSRPVEDDDDLLNLIAYVLLNPIRAGIVGSLRELQQYRWSSLFELCYPERVDDPLVTASAILPLFGDERHRAVEGLLEFLAAMLRADPAGLIDPVSGVEPGEIGTLAARESEELASDCTFALELRTDRIDAVLREQDSIRLIRVRLRRIGWTLPRIVSRACRLTGTRAASLRSGARHQRAVLARALVAHFGCGYLGASLIDVARLVGVSRQAVSNCRHRGAAVAAAMHLDHIAFFDSSLA